MDATSAAIAAVEDAGRSLAKQEWRMKMPKAKNELITAAAREAGNQLAIRDPLGSYMRKITDAQRSEELSGTFTGVIVRHGKITDVVAANGAVKIEE
jgi:hypothetical protein